MIIVVTGGIGSGKSFVSNLFIKQGFKEINLDQMAPTLLQSNEVVRNKMIKLLPDYINTNGLTDRELISSLIFCDPSKVEQLNEIMHPLLRSWYEKIIRAYIASDELVVAEIPLMIETMIRDGYEYYNDMILLVKAPYKIRLTRVLNRKGMTKEKFDAIVGLQLPDSVKSQYSDLVIENDNIDAVSKQVMSIINGEYTR